MSHQVNPYTDQQQQLHPDIALKVLSLAQTAQEEQEINPPRYSGKSLPPVLEDIAEMFSHAVSDPRTCNILFDRWGFAIKESTLEAIGATYSLTRERIRQICDKHNPKVEALFLSQLNAGIRQNYPILTSTIELLLDIAITSRSEDMDIAQRDEQIRLCAEMLKDLHLINAVFNLRSVTLWLESQFTGVTPDLAELSSWWKQRLQEAFPDNLDERLGQYLLCVSDALDPKRQKLPSEIKEVIRRLTLRGFVQIATPAYAERVSSSITKGNIELMQHKNWLIRTDESRNSFRDQIGRVLGLVGPLGVEDLARALGASKPGREDYAIVISPDELEELLLKLPWCRANGSVWEWVSLPAAIGPVDQAIYTELIKLPKVFFWAEAVHATKGVSSIAALSFFLKGPYGDSPKYNMYCIRGTKYSVFDLARKQGPGTKAQSTAKSRFVSHDPDVVHVELPDNWNAQVNVGRFYQNHWSISVEGRTGLAKINSQGNLVSGLQPLLKKISHENRLDLTINTSERRIEVTRCTSTSH